MLLRWKKIQNYPWFTFVELGLRPNVSLLSRLPFCGALIKTELKSFSDVSYPELFMVSVCEVLIKIELKSFSDVSYPKLSMVFVCGVLIKTELKCFSAGKIFRTIHGLRLWSWDYELSWRGL